MFFIEKKNFKNYAPEDSLHHPFGQFLLLVLLRRKILPISYKVGAFYHNYREDTNNLVMV
jgi:hypothetical protein